MDIEVLGPITRIETIAVGNAIREVKRLRRAYGTGRWRKMKGFAKVRLPGGEIREAEVHWYEAHAIGKKDIKVKRLLGA